MSIEVTARNDEVQRAAKYARSMAEELIESFDGIEHVHVILDAEKHRRMAEVIVQGRHRLKIEASDEEDRIQIALDQAFEKAERQLRKVRDKITDHHPRS
jgi:putative sigma-54 modulation protein